MCQVLISVLEPQGKRKIALSNHLHFIEGPTFIRWTEAATWRELCLPLTTGNSRANSHRQATLRLILQTMLRHDRFRQLPNIWVGF